MKFIDLQAQYKKIHNQLDKNIIKILHNSKFIMGEEVKILENQLLKYSGTKFCVSCANGTDALTLSLMALNVKKDDTVFVPSFTYVSTAESVAQLGAIPYMVDVNKDNFNICGDSLENAIKSALKNKYNIKAIIAVDLFGYPSDRYMLNRLAKKYKLKLIIDAAQSFGSRFMNNKFGLLADIVTTSFFPSKPLGCYGDGGAIFTNNKKIYQKIFSLRVHGSGRNKYDNIYVGLNSRLDTIQAEVLIQKLKIFDNELQIKEKIAQTYQSKILDYFIKPMYMKEHSCAWALYTIRLKKNRQKFINYLKNNSIPYFVYYPKPIHVQKAYKHFPRDEKGCPNSVELSKQVVSIPLHAYLSKSDLKKVINVVNNFKNEYQR